MCLVILTKCNSIKKNESDTFVPRCTVLHKRTEAYVISSPDISPGFSLYFFQMNAITNVKTIFIVNTAKIVNTFSSNV